jgi:ABC-type proline/glycine betaine transport system substrate-binding protein
MKAEWISVKDKLPNKEQIVLMYYDGDILIGHIQIVYSDGSARFKETNGIFLYNIPATHWMPLPEKPK